MANDIWQQLLSMIKEEVGSRIVETWLKAIVLVKWDYLSKTVYLRAPNTFVRDWVQKNYLSLLQMHLGRLYNTDQIHIIFNEPEHQLHHEPGPGTDQQVVQGKKSPSSNSGGLVQKMGAKMLASSVNRAYLFETFVVGPSNQLAYAACQAVAQKPGVLYNPLFIYGPSGLGKTHLLHAIGNQIKLQNKKAIVLYQTADRFVNEFISAIRFDKVHHFQEKYKHVDVLLIDDIQCISNKDQTQEAFFHIFNSLHQLHKQIVFSSDVYPRDIQGIADRLRSRLEWGLVTDIQMPTFETKIAIVQKKAHLNNEILPDDVADYIASRVFGNIRELEGALIRVCAFASLTGQMVTLDLAKKVLNRAKESRPSVVDFARIAKYVSAYYAYEIPVLRADSRSKDLVKARQVAMYLMKQMTDKSLHEIGLFWGRKDHSTVVHAVAKIHNLRSQDSEFNNQLKSIEQQILG